MIRGNKTWKSVFETATTFLHEAIKKLVALRDERRSDNPFLGSETKEAGKTLG
jgi:hypothetical protein